MDVSLLSFTPKLVEKKDVNLRIISSKLVFQSPRRRRKQNAFPLRDIGSSPSNLQNIEKNRNSTCRNISVTLSDSPCLDKSKVKFGHGETIVLETSDSDSSSSFRSTNIAKDNEIIVIDSDSEEFISDSQPDTSEKIITDCRKNMAKKSGEDNKEKEIEKFLNDLQEFIYERRTPGSSIIDISQSSPETSADVNEMRLGSGRKDLESEEEKRRVAKSNINSSQDLKQRKNYEKEVKETVPVDTSSSSSRLFKKTPKRRDNQREKCENAVISNGKQDLSPPRGKEVAHMDDEKFENIVQWLDKVETPGRASGKESDEENSIVRFVRRPGCRLNVILSESESENDLDKSSKSSSKKRKSDSESDSADTNFDGSNGKKQILSSDGGSSSSESFVVKTKKRIQFITDDDECNSSKSRENAKVVLSPGFSAWRMTVDEGSENSSAKSKPEVNDSSSELSHLSATSMDRLLSDIYGDTWDKETVLTPVVKKIENIKQVKTKTAPRILKDIPSSKKTEKKQVPKAVSRALPLNLSDQENIPTPPHQVSTPFKFPKPSCAPKTRNIPRTPVSAISSPQPTITLGFLRSLSVSPPSAQCNVKALYYKKDFKSKKEALTAELFAYYNKVIFDSKLPGDMKIEWNARLNRTAGYCYNSTALRSGGRVRVSRIELATKVCTSPDRVRDTLIHELCHAAVWVLDGVKGGHGPQWKAWANKAMKKLPELPPIGRCHQYKIETKYTYKCKSCGYSIGRHSKSLDLERKRCGWCYGEFELLVNTKSRKAGAPGGVTPRTPRVATGFALFVKENYKSMKEREKNLKHSEIMKMLGAKFASLKMQAP